MSLTPQLLFASLFAISLCADAAVTITVQESKRDVVVVGAGLVGSLNGLTSQGALASPAVLVATNGLLISTNGTGALWSGMRGPSRFGSGEGADITSSQGNFFVVSAGPTLADGPLLGLADQPLPQAIDFSMRLSGQTIASLGLDVGHYTWTWGTPEVGDSVTLHVLAPAAPASAWMAWLAAAALLVLAAATSAVLLSRRHNKTTAR